MCSLFWCAAFGCECVQVIDHLPEPFAVVPIAELPLPRDPRLLVAEDILCLVDKFEHLAARFVGSHQGDDTGVCYLETWERHCPQLSHIDVVDDDLAN